jgi:anti-sigma regulatory factor (Ser/Thr protein kinase)
MADPVKNVRSAMFLARRAELRPMSAFLEAFCGEASVERSRYLRLNVVLEELFLNTVSHGHRGDCDAPVWITLEEKGGQVSLTYEDRAPPFNPFSRATREMLEALADTRREGGLGVLLAHGLTATAEYAYLFGRNRIRLTLA